MNELSEERYQELISYLKRISLVQDQILTKLSALEPPKQAPATRPLPSTELEERAKLLACPECNGEVKVRFRKSDGNPFFGCSCFPDCKGILPGTAQPSASALAKQAKLSSPITRPPAPPSRPAPQSVDKFEDAPF